MKKYKKRLKMSLLILSIFIMAVLLNSNHVFSYVIGQKITLGYMDLMENTTFLCAEHGQELWSSGKQYTVKEEIFIKGNQSTGLGGKVVNSWYNAKLASILQTSRWVGEVEDMPVQNAVWAFLPTWLNKVGATYGVGSSFSTGKGPNTDVAYQSILNTADTYANSLKDSSFTDNTQQSKLVVTPYEKGNETFLRIGPFKIKYGGTLSNVKLIDNNNKEITPVEYGKYVGSSYQKISKISNIGSNTEFYIDIKIPSDASSITKIKVSRKQNVKTASVAFFECSQASWQNLLQYSSGTDNITETKEYKHNITLYGGLKIIKTDETTKEGLSGVGFTLKMTSGSQKGKYVSVNSLGNAVYNTNVSTIKTDNSGVISIKLMWPGTYELIETINPHEGYEDLPKNISSNIVIKPGIITTQEVTNKRKYINIEGYAWEDIPWEVGKEEYVNGIYNANATDNKDKKIANVTVQLKDRNEKIVSTKTTGADGSYIFNKVEIDKLKDYYIEFIYNGMSYKSVDVKGLTLLNTTKAIEASNRTKFNSEYEKITKGKSNKHNLSYETSNYNSKILYGNKSNYQYGYQGQENPINGVDAQYKISATTKNAYLAAGGRNTGYLTDIMSADIIRQNKVEKLSNINLGVTKRYQPDLSVVKDLETVKVDVNGESHIYKYADRFTNKAVYGDGYTMNPKVKFEEKYGNMSYTRALYESDIYYDNADTSKELKVKVTYKIGVRNNSDKLTSIVNEMTDYYDTKYRLIGVGKEINADGSIKNNSTIKPQAEQSGNSSYNKIRIPVNLELTTQGEGYIYIQFEIIPANIVTIVENNDERVKLDNITEITSYTTKDKNGAIYAGIDIDSQPDNIEIGNIKTYEDDTDKAPGLKLVLQENRKITGKVFVDQSGEVNTNEEYLIDGVATGKVRQGDGKYTEGEDGIQGVTVRLVDKNGNIAKMYQESRWIDAEVNTDENGEYEFGGLLPAEYKIIYIWGDKTYKVQDYKSTIVDKTTYNRKAENEEWYKDEFKKTTNGVEWDTSKNAEIRVSDAVDNYETREKIDKQTESMTNANKNILEDYEDTNKIKTSEGLEENLITKMDSSTHAFKVNLEYSTTPTNSKDEYELDENDNIKMNGIYVVKKEGYKNEIVSIDLGIVERAKQVLDLDKDIRSVKIILADESILVNARIENGKLVEDTKYVAYIPKSEGANGQIKLEIDAEIMQSARLEIEYELKVTNLSELDYTNKEFYMYGKGHSENKTDLVTLNPQKVIDYLDDNLATDMENDTDWKAIQNNTERKDLIKQGILEDSENMKNILNSTDKIVITEKLSKELKPLGIEGEQSSITLGMKGYKLLASTSDETFLENNAEIIKIEKTGGATIITTPGNYVPGLSGSEVDDAKSESLVILPPTGLSTDYIAYIILAISSLGILVSGIILIKKFVLKNKS